MYLSFAPKSFSSDDVVISLLSSLYAALQIESSDLESLCDGLWSRNTVLEAKLEAAEQRVDSVEHKVVKMEDEIEKINAEIEILLLQEENDSAAARDAIDKKLKNE